VEGISVTIKDGIGESVTTKDGIGEGIDVVEVK